MAFDPKQRKQEYAQKLRDPRWQKKRLRILERDNWACRRCCSTEATLHVHHQYYESGKEPWDYEDDAFLTLCEECHELEGSRAREEERLLIVTLRRRGLLNEELLELATAAQFAPQTAMLEVVVTAFAWALRNPSIQKQIVDRYLEHCGKVNAGAAGGGDA